MSMPWNLEPEALEAGYAHQRAIEKEQYPTTNVLNQNERDTIMLSSAISL